ncbi:hypothetical protein GGH99_004222 [Coemansia sp. RSA 1285]|nr:hypothetical protein GGH99_004222 [Coemansia sp. RSA 1285]
MRLGSMTLSLHPFSATRWIASQESAAHAPPALPSDQQAPNTVFGRHYAGPATSGSGNGISSESASTEPLRSKQQFPEPAARQQQPADCWSPRSAAAAAATSALFSAAENTTTTATATATAAIATGSGGGGGRMDITSPQAAVLAAKAHEMLESMRHRHRQLARFLQAFNAFKANPLGGAMCSEMEEKIHQMALLIRTQQHQLTAIVGIFECHGAEDDENDGSAVGFGSTSSSLLSNASNTEATADHRLSKQKPVDTTTGAPPPATAPATTNWLATIRVSVLREVIDFSVTEVKRIEQCRLLTRYPAQKKTARSAIRGGGGPSSVVPRSMALSSGSSSISSYSGSIASGSSSIASTNNSSF